MLQYLEHVSYDFDVNVWSRPPLDNANFGVHSWVPFLESEFVFPTQLRRKPSQIPAGLLANHPYPLEDSRENLSCRHYGSINIFGGVHKVAPGDLQGAWPRFATKFAEVRGVFQRNSTNFVGFSNEVRRSSTKFDRNWVVLPTQNYKISSHKGPPNNISYMS